MSGSLIVVGTGMRLGHQCTPEARDAIGDADVVYAGLADPIAQAWLATLNANIVSLQHFYGCGRTRVETYAAMVEAIMGGVRSGKRVCAAFYGHAGVFVSPSHAVIRRARAEGFQARMLAAVSAEDCLFADLGVDPGALGCQSYEATDFLLNARRIDPTAALVLWQIAIAGDLSLQSFEPDPRRLALLGEILMRDYGRDHDVVIYEAATLPVTLPRLEKLALCDLHAASVSQSSTLYVPPLGPPLPCPERLALVRARLG